MMRLKRAVLRTTISAAGAGAVLACGAPAMAGVLQIAPTVTHEADAWFGSVLLPEELGLPAQDFFFVSPDLSLRTIRMIGADAGFDPRLPQDEATWITAALKAALLPDSGTTRDDLESALLTAFDAIQRQSDVPLTFAFEDPELHGQRLYTAAHETERVYGGHRTPGGADTIRRTLTRFATTGVTFHEMNLRVLIDPETPVAAPLPAAVAAGIAAMTVLVARRTKRATR